MIQARMIDDKDLALIAGGGAADLPLDLAELVDLPRDVRRIKMHKAGPQFDIGPNTPDEVESETSGASGSGTVAFRM